MVDLLLDGARGQQSVDGHLLGLPYPPSPLPCLCVRARVPVRVKDNHTIGSSQVHPQPTHTSGQQEQVD